MFCIAPSCDPLLQEMFRPSQIIDAWPHVEFWTPYLPNLATGPHRGPKIYIGQKMMVDHCHSRDRLIECMSVAGD